jgi:hypothetical protein
VAQRTLHTMNQDGSAVGKALVHCGTVHYIIERRLFRSPPWSAAMRICSDTVQAERFALIVAALRNDLLVGRSQRVGSFSPWGLVGCNVMAEGVALRRYTVNQQILQ